MASPVKGGGVEGDPGEDLGEGETESGQGSAEIERDDVVMEGSDIQCQEGRKERERPVDAWKMNASRRASLASRALSQSLSSLPPANVIGARMANGPGSGTVGLMGPPATPLGKGGLRNQRNRYPASTLLVDQTRDVTRSGTRTLGMTLRMRSVANGGVGGQSAPGALGKVRGGVEGHVSSRRREGKGKEREGNGGVGSVLEDYKIFVDVRTDDGDDAGALFVDMLKGMGAKVCDYQILTLGDADGLFVYA
jgi:hypothetical protein